MKHEHCSCWKLGLLCCVCMQGHGEDDEDEG